jgi:arabinan endo-1,5-alpha-L-arabinosidase
MYAHPPLPPSRPIRAFRKLFYALAVFAMGGASALALDGMIRVHDPSTVIKCEGAYYVFGTGRGIPILTSSNGFDWQRSGRVFDRIPDTVKSYVPGNNGMDVWAPEIVKVNGEYHLYYAVSSWGSFVSAVGLATSPTLNQQDPAYKWTDRGMVVHSSSGEALNAIDPGVVNGPDGRYWLCYGSYHGNIQLVELDPKTGLRIAANSPVSIISGHSEASNIIFHGGYYYLFVNHGSCCRGVQSTYNIRVGRSVKVTGPYLDRSGDDMARGGGTLFVASDAKDIGPGQFGYLAEDGVEKFSCHYEGVVGENGRAVMDIRPLLWTADGWPLAGTNIQDGTYQLRPHLAGMVLQSSTNRVELDSDSIHENQKFAITPAGGGFYKIIIAADGNALDAAAGAVHVAPFTRADSQLWKIDQLSDGSYRIASSAGKFALTAASKIGSANGIALHPFTGDPAQRWTISSP